MSWFSDKGKRSWVASLIFLVMVIGLIFFFTYMHIPDKNKDVIVGIVGMIIGSISSMISIFSGRDPDDIKDLKEEIIKLNDDRSTLISRLRDAQMDKESLRNQHQALQHEVINRLSIFVGIDNLMRVGRIDEKSKKEIEKWIPNKINNDELVSDAPKNMRTFNSDTSEEKELKTPVTKEPKPSIKVKEENLDDGFWKDFNKK